MFGFLQKAKGSLTRGGLGRKMKPRGESRPSPNPSHPHQPTHAHHSTTSRPTPHSTQSRNTASLPIAPHVQAYNQQRQFVNSNIADRAQAALQATKLAEQRAQEDEADEVIIPGYVPRGNSHHKIINFKDRSTAPRDRFANEVPGVNNRRGRPGYTASQLTQWQAGEALRADPYTGRVHM